MAFEKLPTTRLDQVQRRRVEGTSAAAHVGSPPHETLPGSGRLALPRLRVIKVYGWQRLRFVRALIVDVDDQLRSNSFGFLRRKQSPCEERRYGGVKRLSLCVESMVDAVEKLPSVFPFDVVGAETLPSHRTLWDPEHLTEDRMVEVRGNGSAVARASEEDDGEVQVGFCVLNDTCGESF